MTRKNNLRVWAVWDPVISRLEYISESQSACRQIIELFRKSGRVGYELLRFDLSPLYYDPPVGRRVRTDPVCYRRVDDLASVHPVRPVHVGVVQGEVNRKKDK